MSKLVLAIACVFGFVGVSHGQEVLLVGCPSGSCAGGSCGSYFAPSYASPGVYAQPIVTVPGERHHIVNTGTVHSKYYVKVRIPEGTIHTVPVINGWLPAITVKSTYGGKPYELVLDYSERIAHTNQYGKNGYISYTNENQAGAAKKKITAAPAPKHPDLIQNYGNAGSSQQRRLSDEEIDLIVDKLKGKLPSIDAPRGSTETPKPEGKAPAPSRSRLDDDLMRPSQIEDLPSAQFPRY